MGKGKTFTTESIGFLKHLQDRIFAFGAWDEIFKPTALLVLESNYKTEIIRHWKITDVVLNGDKFLIKWEKRFEPLTDEQIQETYNRKTN